MAFHSVKPEEVRHMAKLSRLVVSEGEVALFCQQFSEILSYMDLLATANTEGLEPLYTPAEQPEWQRNDDAENLRSQKEILANAPQTDGENFIVPKIV